MHLAPFLAEIQTPRLRAVVDRRARRHRRTSPPPGSVHCSLRRQPRVGASSERDSSVRAFGHDLSCGYANRTSPQDLCMAVAHDVWQSRHHASPHSAERWGLGGDGTRLVLSIN